MKSLIALVVTVWLIVGVVAAAQRDYFSGDKAKNCGDFSTTALTIVSGPLNYMGANPKVKKCKGKLPQPSR